MLAAQAGDRRNSEHICCGKKDKSFLIRFFFPGRLSFEPLSSYLTLPRVKMLPARTAAALPEKQRRDPREACPCRRLRRPAGCRMKALCFESSLPP